MSPGFVSQNAAKKIEMLWTYMRYEQSPSIDIGARFRGDFTPQRRFALLFPEFEQALISGIGELFTGLTVKVEPVLIEGTKPGFLVLRSIAKIFEKFGRERVFGKTSCERKEALENPAADVTCTAMRGKIDHHESRKSREQGTVVAEK